MNLEAIFWGVVFVGWRLLLTVGALAAIWLALAVYYNFHVLNVGLQCDDLQGGGMYCAPVVNGPVVLGPPSGVGHD